MEETTLSLLSCYRRGAARPERLAHACSSLKKQQTRGHHHAGKALQGGPRQPRTHLPSRPCSLRKRTPTHTLTTLTASHTSAARCKAASTPKQTTDCAPPHTLDSYAASVPAPTSTHASAAGARRSRPGTGSSRGPLLVAATGRRTRHAFGRTVNVVTEATRRAARRPWPAALSGCRLWGSANCQSPGPASRAPAQSRPCCPGLAAARPRG